MAYPTGGPSNRGALRDYCFRRLGHPVVKINVSEDQVSDRIDDAVQYFAEIHEEGSQRLFLKHVVTQTDIDQGYIDISSSASSELYDPNDLITSVVRVFHIGTSSSSGLFNLNYRIALNDLWPMHNGSMDLVQYSISKSHLALMRDMLNPEKTVRFNRIENKIYLDMDWNTRTAVGEYLVFEVYKIMDAEVFNEIYNNSLLKRYCTALIQRQWGFNLSKFEGAPLPGGISFNGDKILSEAKEEIDKVENDLKNQYTFPPNFFMG